MALYQWGWQGAAWDVGREDRQGVEVCPPPFQSQLSHPGCCVWHQTKLLLVREEGVGVPAVSQESVQLGMSFLGFTFYWFLLFQSASLQITAVIESWYSTELSSSFGACLQAWPIELLVTPQLSLILTSRPDVSEGIPREAAIALESSYVEELTLICRWIH